MAQCEECGFVFPVLTARQEGTRIILTCPEKHETVLVYDGEGLPHVPPPPAPAELRSPIACCPEMYEALEDDSVGFDGTQGPTPVGYWFSPADCHPTRRRLEGITYCPWCGRGLRYSEGTTNAALP